jgi:hypothetical protein
MDERRNTMSRAFARRCAVALVAFTIVLVGLPTHADARPLNSKPTIGVATNGWLNAATAWFGGLLNRMAGQVPTGKKAPAAPTQNSTTAPIVVGGGGGAHTNTGSCIDPLGRPYCAY